MSATLPLVSVVVPMFNEEQSIGACLGSIAAQDYPHDRMEVVVVDGASTDRSRAIVESFHARLPQLRIVTNPRRLTPISLNLGWRAAAGDFVVRMDAHSTMAPDYVRCCVETQGRTGAANVGGLMRAEGANRRGTAIALATSSRFGVGGARFHYAQEEGPADTVYLGCYRRALLEALGGYDESMIINEDDELNFRITQRGETIFLSPAIRSTYRPRSSFTALWKQYFRYGKWKVRLMQKHGAVPSLRHLAPGAFAGALLLGLVVWPFSAAGRGLFLTTAGAYALANAAATVAVALRHGWQHAALLPVAFGVLHLAYGTGFLAGVVRFVLLRRTTGLTPRPARPA